MSLGLLGAYDSSSDSSSESEEEKVTEMKPETSLSNPFRASNSGQNKPSFMVQSKDYTSCPEKSVSEDQSVFSNPFRAKEERKKLMLEKHVEMTAPQEQLKRIDGKKVCWNFRKGRCRFGHKCTFAHDSDVNVAVRSRAAAAARAEEDKDISGAIISTKEDAPNVNPIDGTSKAKLGTKRPGLSQGLVPGKKAMKFHQKVYGEKK